MMGWTDRHERYFLRLLSRNSWLYTEMINPGAILHGNRDRFLGFSEAEHPVALQLGGSNPEEMAACARLAEEWGFDEVNMNVGCPSQKGGQRRFGACLMAYPELVAENLQAMREAISIPVTVKTRIGIDRQDTYEPLAEFVEVVRRSGVKVFIIHARKAWLDGLSPKDNRHKPPLRYEYVYRLKREHPDLEIIINGGIKTLDDCKQHLEHVDGVMVGREAYYNPYILTGVDAELYQDPHAVPSRAQVMEQYVEYVKERMRKGTPLFPLVRHLIGLYAHQPRARLWRRKITEESVRKGVTPEDLLEFVAEMEKACV